MLHFIAPLVIMAQPMVNFKLQEGDLLFQDSDCGDFCKAIRKVTTGVNGLDFSHIGLVVNSENGELAVIEAVSEGVVLTALKTFLNRTTDTKGLPKVVVGRLKEPYGKLIPMAVSEAHLLIGKPYDNVFDIKNDAYYCSELVYKAFKIANNGEDIFHLQPMTFIDPDTGKTFPIWIDYFKNLQKMVPEGKPGLNPGGISKSEKIEIFYPYSRFDIKTF